MVKLFSGLTLLAGLVTADVIDLNKDNFKSSIESKDLSIVKFFAPWCGHCKAMANDWLEAGKLFNSEENVLVGNVDCTIEKALCSENGVKGYPTLKAFKKDEYFDDGIPRKLPGIITYVNKNAGTNVDVPEASKPKPKSEAPYTDSYKAGSVHKVVNSNFQELVMKSDKHVFLKVYAPWCGHCKKMAPAWEEFAKNMESRYDDVVIAEYDATANDLESAYQIKGYPTVFWCEKGNKGNPVKYEGARTLDAWTQFINDKIPEGEEEIVEEAKEESKDEL